MESSFVERLDPDALHCVAAWLDTADLARLGATCARLRASVLEDDALWRSACVRDWGLAPPLDVGSGRDVWRRAHAAFGAVGAAYAHARRVWTRLEGFCARAFRPGLHSLRPGLTVAEVALHERALGVRLPAPFAASLLVHDGQDGRMTRTYTAPLGWHAPAGLPLAGLLGGTCVYGETHVMALTRAGPHSERITRGLRGHAGIHARLVVVADRRNLDDTGQGFLLLDTESGIVYALCEASRLVRVVSHAGALASHARHGLPPPESPHRDSYCWLRYLAELADRLEGGVFRVRRYDNPGDAADGAGGEAAAPSAAAHAEWATALYGPPAARTATAGTLVPPTPLARLVRPGSRLTEAQAWVATLRANPLEFPADFGGGGYRYICAFPEAGPCTALAETAGVHVHVATVLRLESVLGLGAVAGAQQPAAETAAGFQRGGSPAVPAAPHIRGGGGTQLQVSYRVRLWYGATSAAPEAEEEGAPPGGGGPAPAAPQPCDAARVSSGHAPHGSIQLASRRWVVTDAAGKESTVEGPGVIGQYPLLRPLPAGVRCVDTTDASTVAAAVAAATAGVAAAAGGGGRAQSGGRVHAAVVGGGGGEPLAARLLVNGLPVAAAAGAPHWRLPEPFEYCSITGLRDSASGAMRGALAFTPGSLDIPRGPAFEAAVPVFQLGVPDLVYC